MELELELLIEELLTLDVDKLEVLDELCDDCELGVRELVEYSSVNRVIVGAGAVP